MIAIRVNDLTGLSGFKSVTRLTLSGWKMKKGRNEQWKTINIKHNAI